MRKLLFIIFVLFNIAFVSSYASAQEFDGYIFEPKYAISAYSIFASEFKHIGNGIYTADSLEDIYSVYEPDELVTVYPNYKLELFETAYPETTSDEKIGTQWNLNMINADISRYYGVFGEDIKIAVIDSGLDTNHRDLDKSKILKGYNCVPGTSDTADVTDNVGHGTIVTGIIAARIDNKYDIAGIAPNVSIIPIKITNSDRFDMSNLYIGINKAIELGADIINMSLGEPLTDPKAIEAFKKYIDKAHNEGILMIAAGGNSGSSAVNYPAGFDNVIGVGTVNSGGELDSTSHINESIFITAPGSYVPCLIKGSGSSSKSGSSLAAPHVTAAAALIKQLKPGSTIDDVKKILADTATDKGDIGYDTSYGYGILNIEGIMNTLIEYIPDIVISQGTDGFSPRLHIHNNSENIAVKTYFAGYTADKLPNAIQSDNLILLPGVTTLNYSNSFDTFFLWTDKLKPLINKYTMEK